MSLTSMTGFARASGETNGFLWNWEAKSVNSKGLDVRCRVPSLLDGFDVQVRKRVSAVFSRGAIAISLDLTAAERTAISVDRDRLEALVALAAEYRERPGITPPSFDGLLAMRGVLDGGQLTLDDEDRTSLERGLMAGLDAVSTDLKAARDSEGAGLTKIVAACVDALQAQVEAAEASAGAQLTTIRQRLEERLNELLGDRSQLNNERLEQEVAVLALRHDVREELDRLREHIQQARTLMAEHGPVGRKFDFLAQEFNREANTLCSKSADSELTGVGLTLKATIDQLREQIQNVE